MTLAMVDPDIGNLGEAFRRVVDYINTNIGGGGGLLSSGVISLSSAQLLDLTNTPIEIVAAPGANEAIVPVQAISTLTFVANPYGNNVSAELVWGGISEEDDYYQQIGFAPFSSSNSNDSFAFWQSDGGFDFFKEDTAGVALSLLATTDTSTGPIVSATLGDDGSGYAPGDTGGIGDGGATYTVDTVDGGGAVLTFTVDDHGTNSSVANGVATSVSTGDGDGAFTVNITAVQPGDGTGTIEVFYRIVSWP